jgi:hypothetical protein
MWKNIKGVNVKNNTPEAQQKENEGNEDKFEVSASLVLRSPDVPEFQVAEHCGVDDNQSYYSYGKPQPVPQQIPENAFSVVTGNGPAITPP